MSLLKKETKQLQEAANKLMEYGLKSGAETVEICGSYQQQTKISLEKQDYHLAASDQGYQFGIRVLLGEQMGFASCNSYDSKELKDIASRAVTLAKLAPKNPYNDIIASENIPKEAPAPVTDTHLQSLSLQTQKDWVRHLGEAATHDERFRLNGGSVDVSAQSSLVLNSKGTHKVDCETRVDWSVMGMAVEGENITSFDYFGQMSRTADKVGEKIVESARSFSNQVLRTLKNGPAKPYRGCVVFSPRAVIEILGSAIQYHLSGRSVADKKSKWNLSTLDQTVLNEALTYEDLPWQTDRSGFGLFDREGIPTRDRIVIENGVLRSFLMDLYSARALERTPTGHAAGGPSSLPTVGTHCFCLRGGEESLPALMKRTAEYQEDFLLVHRFSGQTNPVTGDFSGVAKGADWWHSGERIYTVKETLISGNVFEALTNGLFGITSEVEVIDASRSAPTLVIDNISVTA